MTIIFPALLWFLYTAVQVIIMSFLLQPVILLAIYLFRLWFGFKNPHSVSTGASKNYRFGIVITAHRDTKFIPPIIDSLLKQTYPHFNVYVVADDCDLASIPNFGDSRIHILKPPTSLNTNTKSINYALGHFTNEEVMVIFDPDNLVHSRFIEVLNEYYNKGYKAVQGNLYAKNTANLYERMDSIGVVFNNFVDRDIRSALNLSVNTWGCGISVKTDIYRNIKYDERSVTGGFDKHMQAQIAKSIPFLAYASNAVFYDEKVSDGQNLERQRSRWIRSYFKFLPDAFGVFFTGIRKGNFNLAYFGYNLIRPPYFLQILTGLLFMSVNFYLYPSLGFVWIFILTVFVLSLAAIVIIRNKNKSVRKGLWYAPLFFYHQIQSFLKIRLNKTSILKTENSKVLYIDDILKHDIY